MQEQLFSSNTKFDARLVKYSQQSFLSNLYDEVKNFVSSNIDKNHPVKSIIENFFISGLVWKINPWLGAAYLIAEVAGVNWGSFWDKVIDDIEEYVSSFTSAGKKVPEDGLKDKATSALQSAVDNLTDNSPDQITPDQTEKLESIVKQQTYVNHDIIKNAGWASSLLKVVGSKLIKIGTWVIVRCLAGLGMTIAAGAGSSILGTNKDRTENQPQDNQQQQTIVELIPVSKSAPEDLFDYHPNSLNYPWVESGDTSQASDALLTWTLQAYPQLQKYSLQIEQSSAFTTVLNKILRRNAMVHGYPYYIIPPPYNKKLDMVQEIVSGFVNEYMHSN